MRVTYSLPIRGSGEVLSGYLETSEYSDSFSNKISFQFIETLVRQYTIYPRFRLFVLNTDETERYEIPQEDILQSGSYSENYQSGQRRSLQISLLNESGKYTPSINGFWTGTKISFEVGLMVPDTMDKIIWFKKGIYVVNKITPTRTTEGKTVSIELGDKFCVLEGRGGVLVSSMLIPMDTLVQDVFSDILLMDMGNGRPFDTKKVIVHQSFKDTKIPIDLTEQPGATWGSVILKIADMISAEVFYNTEGHLTVVPKIEMADDGNKPTIFHFYAYEGDFQNNDLDLEMENIVNRVVVIGANVNGRTFRAESVNNSATSPISYQRIGYRTGEIINDSNITSDTLAQERADYELRMKSIIRTSANNTIFFNPLLTVNNLISLSDDFFNLTRDKFLLQSISFSLDYNGIMTITSTNTNNLPFMVQRGLYE